MVFPILGGNSAVAGGYTIDNSIMFNDGDSPKLVWNSSGGTDGNQKTWTFSGWVKRSTLGTQQAIFTHGENNSGEGKMFFDSDDKLAIQNDGQNGSNNKTARVFRDVSSWYHIVWAVDANQASNNDRWKLYINGELVPASEYGSPTINNANGYIQRYSVMDVGIGVRARYQQAGNAPMYFDGYTSECHFIDGQQLDASSFGEFDTDSGIWKPIEYTGSYGTNGFYLNFSNTSNVGEDTSGNGNNFTVTNIDPTACRGHVDTPTNNFCTINPLTNFGGGSINVGNLKIDSGNDMIATMGVTSGRWYWEARKNDATTTGHWGISCANFHRSSSQNVDSSTGVGTILLRDESSNNYFYQNSNGITITSVVTDNNLGVSQNQIVGVYLDLDSATKSISFYVNGSLDVKINFTYNDTSIPIYPLIRMNSGCSTHMNFGSPAISITSGNSDANGYGNFEYNPTLSGTDYLALCTQNLATELSPTIDDGSQYFNTVLYTGNGGTKSITGVNFQPDWVWLKQRANDVSNRNHMLFDSNRGTLKALSSNTTGAEDTSSAYLTSYDSDGFTLGSSSVLNRNTTTYASWNWLANGGTTSSNTDGSITSTVQANTTAGFSIVTYTGTQANATVGHGLGVAPKFIITKCRSSANGFPVYHYSLSATDFVRLNQSSATATNSVVWNNTEPTSTVFTVGANDENNKSGADQLAYCFAEIEGYSKFGSYTGNGSTNGTFIYTGFRPAFVIYKNTSSATDWRMFDNKRNAFNVIDGRLFPNTSDAENTAQDTVDFLSNGFKLRATNSGDNGSGNTFIYMCFASNPLVSSSGVPVVAR